MTTGFEILVLVLGLGYFAYQWLTFDADAEARRTFEAERREELSAEWQGGLRRMMRICG